MNHTVLVVSDKFVKFSDQENVLTKTELLSFLNKKKKPYLTTPKTILFIPGQGLGQESIEEILNNIPQQPDCDNLDFHLFEKLPNNADKHLTHKHKSENILITKPDNIDKDKYTCHLQIDERSELMEDHQTGQHIQGMILIEACRQNYIAIVEEYFLSKSTINKDFIFDKMFVNYSNFAYPIPTIIKSSIINKSSPNGKRESYKMNCDIYQNCSVIASITLEATMLPNKSIAFVEERKAGKSLHDFISHYKEQSSAEQHTILM